MINPIYKRNFRGAEKGFSAIIFAAVTNEEHALFLQKWCPPNFQRIDNIVVKRLSLAPAETS